MTALEDLPAAHTSECQCTCENCTRCHTRTKQLPPTHYVMSVKSDIFRRMFDEVSASKSMPCGLFFCGHHEDVRYPSVTIAVVIVSILFVALFLATFFVSGQIIHYRQMIGQLLQSKCYSVKLYYTSQSLCTSGCTIRTEFLRDGHCLSIRVQVP